MTIRAVCAGLLLLGLAGVSACSKSEIPSQSCREDKFCDDDFICHPLAQVCVPRCSTGSDCPVSAKDCGKLDDVPSTQSFCQCQSTQLCAEEDETTVCSTSDRICTPRCTHDVDCAHGRTCDKDTGICQ